MIKKWMSTGMELWIRYREKCFHIGDERVKYILQENKKAEGLLVVFSGFSTDKPRYNYIRTLREVRKVNKLFILDDFGYQNRGSYYLMENGKDNVHKNCTALIKMIAEKVSAKELYCAGSSKGGTAALLYGCELGAKAVISGAPQYYIGNYLNTEKHKKLLYGMLGSPVEEKDIAGLNHVVEQAAKECREKPVVYLHYSPREHTYCEHICFLLKELEKQGFVVQKDRKEYTEHGDVALYFGQYLCQVMNNITRN